jgi:hypothetical protein
MFPMVEKSNPHHSVTYQAETVAAASIPLGYHHWAVGEQANAPIPFAFPVLEL